MAKIDITPEDLRVLRADLADPAKVCRMLDDIQYTACAGLIRFPDLTWSCTAHLFSSPNALYVDVFRAVKSGAKGLYAVFLAVSQFRRSADSAFPLAALASHPVTRWNAARSISQLKKFVSWQYRQEKAKRRAA